MKILSSSPYATFNSKEWNSIKINEKPINTNNPVRLQKKYYNNSKRYEYIEVFNEDIKQPKFVQLAFA